jgi:hypothetical protein
MTMIYTATIEGRPHELRVPFHLAPEHGTSSG